MEGRYEYRCCRFDVFGRTRGRGAEMARACRKGAIEGHRPGFYARNG